MKLGKEVGLGPGHNVLDGDPAPPTPLRPMYCGQRAGWIKVPLGRDVDLGVGDIVLDGDAASPRKGHSNPHLFHPCLLWPNGCPS